jgi:3-oxoacyl-[acyl-carrier protein] reductase
VNAIQPGPTRTEANAALPETLALVKLTPLARFGEASDIADAVLLLVSDEARWITGAIVPVSGGL